MLLLRLLWESFAVAVTWVVPPRLRPLELPLFSEIASVRLVVRDRFVAISLLLLR